MIELVIGFFTGLMYAIIIVSLKADIAPDPVNVYMLTDEQYRLHMHYSYKRGYHKALLHHNKEPLESVDQT